MKGEENPARPDLILNGARVYKQALGRPAQQALVAALRQVVARAPLFAPFTPGGRRMQVRMTSAGRLGWVSDRRGYRYQAHHPNGTPWPDIPPMVLELWDKYANASRQPDSCLINYYGKGARMGLHQDRDEADLTQPVLSLSLGDDALFRIATAAGKSPSTSHWLSSGDVLVLEGPARLAWHGVDRIRYRSSSLLEGGGRLNLTLRVAG